MGRVLAFPEASRELGSCSSMPKARPTSREAEPALLETAAVPEPTQRTGTADAGEYVLLTHEALFVSEGAATGCDACGVSLHAEERSEGEDGYDVRGQGVYHWVRGDERRLEKVPLCPSCAAAIGMAVLARWEIEEEEG